MKECDKKSKFLLLNEKTKNLTLIREFKSLKTLYLIGADAKSLPLISELNQLKILKLGWMKSMDLKNIPQSNTIEILSISDSNKINSLDGINKLTNLKILSIENSKRLNTLNGVETNKLETIHIAGGNIEKTRINTLEPLKNLSLLERIQMSTVRILDEKLSWLNNLRGLKELSFPNNFPTDEYAKLSTHLVKTKCSLFEPYIKMNSTIGGNDVMITGKRKPFLNSQKDKERIEKSVEQFEKTKTMYYKELS